MNATYTNRKGKTYYLCQGLTKTGKPWYYWAREPKGEPVEQIPPGYEVRESVNGLVSLAKTRAVQILPEERALVEAAIRQHPKARNYRLDVKDKRIVVHERTGADVEDLIPLLRRMGGVFSRKMQEMQDLLDEQARFAQVMRFTLLDEEKRTFYTERWYYLGHTEHWAEIGSSGPLHRLVKRFVPLLGTDALFEEF